MARNRDYMQPLERYPAAQLKRVTHLLTDIDDTLTLHGRLRATAYEAMELLMEAGIAVIPVTGRPAGWCDLIAHFWPVDGVIGENGAFYYRYDHDHRNMIRFYAKEHAIWQQDRKRLDEIAQKILSEVPGTAIAVDQPFRIADLAIDFCENVPRLPAEAVTRIVDIFAEAGATAKVSSIHVNGWFGNYDKLSMTKLFFKNEYQIDLDKGNETIVFIGDSPNDQPMFSYFCHSVGVANIQQFSQHMEHLPRWVTYGAEGSHGFSTFARHLLAAREESETV